MKAYFETHFENDYLTPQYLYCCRIEAVKHRKVRSKSRTNASWSAKNFVVFFCAQLLNVELCMAYASIFEYSKLYDSRPQISAKLLL